jgi:hypothetical protein
MSENGPKILKTLVWIEGNAIEPIDTIEFEGKLWLVPLWNDRKGQAKTQPKRLIRLDSLEYQKEPPSSPYQFALSQKLPKSVFSDQFQQQEGESFEVLESPDIWLDLPRIDK